MSEPSEKRGRAGKERKIDKQAEEQLFPISGRDLKGYFQNTDRPSGCAELENHDHRGGGDGESLVRATRLQEESEGTNSGAR